MLTQCNGKVKIEISKIADQLKNKLRDIDTVFEVNKNTPALILSVTGADSAAVVIKNLKINFRGNGILA
ncbi:hypothetical protein [Thermoanaerobacter sp. YS13]|uniref:hypothetical protein n=1 Tax=Thermoanaerobacter sp. YS13 TaxID=1511746 RepID=UPI000A43BE05|nr:hypothetical protein [Thermoanaerobacter sp. YS13]